MDALGALLGIVMGWCYNLVNNYGMQLYFLRYLVNLYYCQFLFGYNLILLKWLKCSQH